MPRAKVIITDDKRAYNKLQTELYKAAKKPMGVFVGILDEDAQQAHGDSTLGQVAIYNEFGTSKIPSRPFIRGPFDAHEGYRSLVTSLMKRMVDGAITIESALNILGAAVAQGMIKGINSHTYAENAESTADRKLSDTPLVDTGDLRDHITYKIEE